MQSVLTRKCKGVDHPYSQHSQHLKQHYIIKPCFSFPVSMFKFSQHATCLWPFLMHAYALLLWCSYLAAVRMPLLRMLLRSAAHCPSLSRRDSHRSRASSSSPCAPRPLQRPSPGCRPFLAPPGTRRPAHSPLGSASYAFVVSDQLSRSVERLGQALAGKTCRTNHQRSAAYLHHSSICSRADIDSQRRVHVDGEGSLLLLQDPVTLADHF